MQITNANHLQQSPTKPNIPNERYGEVVAAFLELEDGHRRPDNEIIREWVRGTLSRYKVPVRIWWLGDVENGCPGGVAKDCKW